MRDQQPNALPRKPSRASVAAGALGVTAAVALGVVWLTRVQLAGWALDQYFNDRHVSATFEIESVDFGGINIQALDLGGEARADTAQAILRWRGLAPNLDGIVVRGLRAHGRWDENGLSLGVVDRLRSAADQPLQIPDLGLIIEDAVVSLDTPLGAARATLNAEGRLRGALSGRLDMSLDRPEGQDVAQTALLSGDADALTISLAPANDSDGPALSGTVRAPWSLTGIVADITATAGTFEGFGAAVEGADIQTQFDGDWPAAGRSEPFGMLEVRAAARRFEVEGLRLDDVRLAAITPVSITGLAAPFTLTAQGFSGFGLSGEGLDARGSGQFGADGEFGVTGTLSLASASVGRSGLSRIEDVWIEATGTPLEALSGAGRRAVLGALHGASMTAPFVAQGRTDALQLRLTGPLTMRGGNGVNIAFTPTEAQIALPAGTFVMAGEARVGAAQINELRAQGALGGDYIASGAMAAARWRTAGSALSHGDLAFSAAGSEGALRLELDGPVTLSGPLAGGRVEGLSAPLRLEVMSSAGGVRISQVGGCVPVRFSSLALPSVTFEAGQAGYCPTGGVVAAISPRGTLSGGFGIEELAWAGRQGDAAAMLRTRRIAGSWGGDAAAPTLALTADDAFYAAETTPGRAVGARADAVSALLVLGGAEGFRVTGTFSGGQLSDPLSPVAIEEARGRWAGLPEGDGLVLAVTEGSALVSDRPPPGVDPETYTVRFNPIRLTDLQGTLVGSGARIEGIVREAEGGTVLGRVSAMHDLAGNAGNASLTLEDLTFGPDLQPLDLTEFARGAVIRMDGSVSGQLSARWEGVALAADGQVSYDIAQMAIAAVPDIRAVQGVVVFDDLLRFSTPPGQTVTVGVVNPGVAVRDGAVRFQLLPGGVVRVEDARWQFAAGQLILDPTDIPLSGGDAPLMLRLNEVNAQAAIEALGIQDLTIDGRVEGVFPVMLSASAAIIADGQLRAVAPGRLAYTGPAAEGMTSFADLAFDALSDFRYDDLTVVMNGDLAGDVDIEVRLSGLHAQDNMDLSSLFPLPGGTRATADDVPFRFSIAIHAPFRQLVDTGAGIADARVIVRRTQRPQATDTPPPLDPPAPRSP
jgi:hypothetical protein